MASFRDLFVAIATSAASLTGLLFVVVTVVERPGQNAHPPVVQEVRAAAALLGFTNALAVSLFGIVPGTHIGYPAVVIGAIGILFSAAGLRSLVAGIQGGTRQSRHIVLSLFLMAVFVTELIVGIELLKSPRDTGPLESLAYILIASLFIGIARAWELVGGRDTGVLGSLAVLLGPRRHAAPDASEPSESAPRERQEKDATSP